MNNDKTCPVLESIRSKAALLAQYPDADAIDKQMIEEAFGGSPVSVETLVSLYSGNEDLRELARTGGEALRTISPVLAGSYTASREEEPENPREYDNLGTLIAEDRRYRLGDTNAHETLREALCGIKGLSEKERGILDDLDIKSDLGTALAIADAHDAFLYLPVYGYEHGGLTIKTSSFSDKWDSSLLGIIFVSAEKLAEETKVWSQEWKDQYHAGKTDREIVEFILKEEIKMLDSYLNNDVWCFEVEINGRVVERGGNYYGDEEGAEKDGEAVFVSAMSEAIVEAICDNAAKAHTQNAAMGLFRSKVAGHLDNNALNAIREIAAAAKEADVPVEKIFEGIANGDEETIALFKAR